MRVKAPSTRPEPTLRPGRAARVRLQSALGRSRMFGELVGGADRAAHQLAAAVWTAALEDRVGAAPAERALVGADHGLGRLRRQIAVAAFAVGTQLQHWAPQVS